MKRIVLLLAGSVCIGIGISATRLEDLPKEKREQTLKQWFSSAKDNGKQGEMKKLIKEYPNITNETSSETGKTALHIAAEYRANSIAYMLLDTNAKVNIKDKHGRTPVHYAVMANPKGKSPEGHRDILNSLIKNGADVTIQDKQGKTPLHYAAVGGHPDILKALIKHGADPQKPDVGGKTPIQIAYENNKLDSMVKAASQYSDKKALFNAWFQAVSEDDKQKVEQFIKKYPFIVNVTNNEHRTALHIAVKNQNKDLIQPLLKNGAKVDIKDQHNTTPLQLAQNQLEKAMQHQNVNTVSQTQEIIDLLRKPLYEKKGKEEIQGELTIMFTILSSRLAGKNLGKLSTEDVTDLLEMLHMKEMKEPGIKPLKASIGKNWKSIQEHYRRNISQLMEGNPGVINLPLGPTPRAGQQKPSDSIGSMQKMRGRTIQNRRFETSTHILPIHIAATGYTELTQSLIDKGANVNAKMQGGITPLHCAAAFAQPEIINMLLKHGAQPDITDNKGRTPADYIATKQKYMPEFPAKNEFKDIRKANIEISQESRDATAEALETS